MAKEITLEQALQEIEVLTTKVASLEKENADLKTALAEKTKEAEEEIESLKLEIEAVKEQNASLTKEVPGFFTHKPKGGKELNYRFKKGRFHVIVNGERIAAKDALQNKEIMQKLIELGSGSIEVCE